MPEGSSAVVRDPGVRRRHRRRRVWLFVAAIALLLLLDQLGVRRLSGADVPPGDPLAPTMRAHVEHLASPALGGRVPGTKGNEDAARYIAQQLETLGVPPLPSVGSYFMPIPTTRSGETLGDNVLGWVPGSDPTSTEALLVGAHFDHLGNTEDGLVLGADDNAAAVAVLLAAAPAVRALRLSHPVIFAFFNTEEAPWFGLPTQGSVRFADAPPREVGALSSLRLAVILDLVGGVVWRSSADTLFACGAEKTSGLGALVDGTHEEGLSVRRMGLHLVENLPGYRPQPVSDYDVFRDRQVPFLFLSSGRTPRYHKPSDLPDTLHYDRMARTARWIASLLASVDGQQAPLRFTPAGADLPTDAETMHWAMDAAATPWRSIPGTGPISAARLLGDRARVKALLEPGHTFTSEDELSLERASFRLQCLLYSFPVCFTF
ncbi:M28 family peptidase [Chondromyces apiculatus]|uniref:Peptidase M28 n=1 Tax=Chondromyces apiculatus DSM 436 TaxID=1192034 RepID=A0A017T3Z6_9BACT|nr:M28 family peptidase [Chondromyces apiculatus]EYF03963.1 peptidase M28 [Chondromyces apiculatus DSM 436]